MIQETSTARSVAKNGESSAGGGGGAADSGDGEN